jgi:hypothetical protein
MFIKLQTPYTKHCYSCYTSSIGQRCRPYGCNSRDYTPRSAHLRHYGTYLGYPHIVVVFVRPIEQALLLGDVKQCEQLKTVLVAPLEVGCEIFFFFEGPLVRGEDRPRLRPNRNRR